MRLLDRFGRATLDFFEYAGGVTLLSVANAGAGGATLNVRVDAGAQIGPRTVQLDTVYGRAQYTVTVSATSRMKRPNSTACRASSTCWVARKYFCSSRGAASMNGERLSVTESSPWKNIE